MNITFPIRSGISLTELNAIARNDNVLVVLNVELQ